MTGILTQIERFRVLIGTVLFVLIVATGGVLLWIDFHQPKAPVVYSQLVSATTSPVNIISTSTPNTALVNINKASVAELDKLPGIGPTYANAIVTYRNANGGFKNAVDITKVKGIGAKTYDKLKSLITVGGD